LAQSLSKYSAPFDALVHIHNGEAEMIISGKLLLVNKGDMVVMPVNKPYA